MLYRKDKLLLIAGPCTLENEEVCMKAAEALKLLQSTYTELNIVFKGSFDKANRTSLGSKRGPGINDGLELLAKVKDTYGFPLLTDIHLPEQTGPVAEVCDVLQIPAFLCRQTDLLVAAAQTGKVVNVKKGQFLSPQEMRHVVSKLEESGSAEIWQTERGTLFGYQNLVVDMRSFQIMNEYGHPTIMDATHSVQLPGAVDGTSGGQREFVEVLANAAIAAGCNGLFLETHPDPDNAVSDAQSQIPLSDLPRIIERALKLYSASRN